MAEEKTQKKSLLSEATEEQVAKEQSGKAPEKISYERLNHIAGELQMQNRQLHDQLQRVSDYANALEVQDLFAYHNSLFKVLETPELFSTDFVSACIDDIQTIINRLHKIMIEAGDKEAAESTEQNEE